MEKFARKAGCETEVEKFLTYMRCIAAHSRDLEFPVAAAPMMV